LQLVEPLALGLGERHGLGKDAPHIATGFAVNARLPLQFTPRLAANIAGQVFVIRFIAS
jgi:hypothetical protein